MIALNATDTSLVVCNDTPPPLYNSATGLMSIDFISAARANLFFTEPSPETQECLQAAKAELAVLGSEIERAQAALNLLISRDHDLSTQIRRCESFQTPIRKLPVEVLQEIFEHAFYRVESKWRAPIVLAGVCVHWRGIVNSFPNIWSVFVNDLSSNLNESLVELFLERSGSLPFALLCHPNIIPPTLLRTLERHASHLDYLAIHRLTLRSPFKAQLDNLSTLRICDCSTTIPPLSATETIDEDSSWREIFTNSKLRDVGVSVDVSMFSLPWRQLTHLGLAQAQPLGKTLAVLSQCSSLKLLDFIECRDPEIASNPTSVSAAFTLPRLTDLTFRMSSNTTFNVSPQMSWMEIVLSLVTCPNLQELALVLQHRSSNPARPWNLQILLHKIPKSLERLVLEYVPIETQEFLNTLEMFPDLTSLDCRTPFTQDNDFDSGKVLSRMTLTEDGIDDKKLVPKLKKLGLDFDSCEAFLDMVQSRPLLRMFDCFMFDEEKLAELKRLGLSLNLSKVENDYVQTRDDVI